MTTTTATRPTPPTAPAAGAPTPRARRARNPYLAGLLSPRGLTGLALAGLVALAGLLAPLLTDADPTAQSDEAFAPLSGAHPLGTDELGRDLLSRLLYGIRTDLTIIVLAVAAAAVTGILLALLATASRLADVVVQRLSDLLLAFPGLLMALAITAITGVGSLPVILVIVLAEAPGLARVLRGGILVEREREYAVAARAGGSGPARVLVRHVLPNAVDPLVVQLAVSLSLAVFLEGAMSFLGVGVRAPQPSLGSLLNAAMPYLASHPLYAIAPLIAVTGLVLGFSLIAEALNKGVRR